MPGVNLASRFSDKVDERFYKESQAMLALNNEYDFTGEKTIKVYSIPIATMNDYSRSGSGRYGSPDDLTRNVQTMTVNKDRSFTFIIDKGDKIQSEMVSDAGQALARQLREVVVPEFDTYVFKTLATAAQNAGGYSTTLADKTNAYSLFLNGMEYLGDHNVPDQGRVAFCTYRFCNLLMQDPAFIKYSDKSQEMTIKGVIGEVDGCQIVKVASNRLPAGAAFLITHACAGVGPKQLEDYKIHDDPPGISGWLVEGRMIYDCFVLNEKAHAVYFHGGQGVLKALDVMTAAQSATESKLIVNGVLDKAGNSWVYAMANDAASLPAVTYGGSFTGTTVVGNTADLTPAGATVIRVVELDSASKAIGFADAIINLG